MFKISLIVLGPSVRR